MKNSIYLKIEDWKIENNINRKPLYIPLLKSYRRLMMFHKGDTTVNLVLLANPSEVKQVKKWLIPCNKEISRVSNWYTLTEKGKEVIENLKKTVSWNEKEMNLYFFNLK